MNKLIKLLNKYSEDIFMETNNLICLIDIQGLIIDFNNVFKELAGSLKPDTSNINQFLTEPCFRILFRIISDMKLNKRENFVRIALKFSFESSPFPLLYECIILHCLEKRFIIYGEPLPSSYYEERHHFLTDENVRLKEELKEYKDAMEELSCELKEKNKELFELKNKFGSGDEEKTIYKMINKMNISVKDIKNMTDCLMDTILTVKQMEFVGNIRAITGNFLNFTNNNGCTVYNEVKKVEDVSLNSLKIVKNSCEPVYPFKILIVDDEPVNRKIILKLFEQIGYTADSALNGVNAIEVIEKQDYDVILMDIKMEGMDGLETTRYIRNNIPKEKQPFIIAITAGEVNEDRVLCFNAGMDDYIEKPVKIEKLLEILDKCKKDINNINNVSSIKITCNNRQLLDREDLMDRLNYNESLYNRLINLFINNVPSHIEKLKESLSKGDLKSINFIAHSVKGLSRNICSSTLSDTALEIEEASLEENGNINKLIDKLELEFQNFKNVLDHVR